MRAIFFIILCFVCFLPGCRVHRQVSSCSEAHVNSSQISHVEQSRKDSASAISQTSVSAAGDEWRYTETYYPPTPGDTIPKLQSRSWEGRHSVSETNTSLQENTGSETTTQSIDTTHKQTTVLAQSVSEKKVAPSVSGTFLTIGLILSGLAIAVWYLSKKTSR